MKGGFEGVFPKKEITEKIIGGAFRVHTLLGSGFLEKVYENALANELSRLGFRVDQQKWLDVVYGGEPVGMFHADLLVEKCVVVELKAVKT